MQIVSMRTTFPSTASGIAQANRAMRAQSRTRFCHVYVEGVGALRDDSRAMLRHLDAEAFQHGERRAARKQAQVYRHDVKEGGQRDGEEEVDRRKHAQLRGAPSVERPRQGYAEPHKACLLQPQLQPARADERHRDAWQACQQPEDGRLADRLLELAPRRPQHI